MSKNLLLDYVIADIETTGLHRGAGIKEMALYDSSTRTVREYIIYPNLAVVYGGEAQDVLGLASRSTDVIVRHPAISSTSSWMDVVKAQLEVKLQQPVGSLKHASTRDIEELLRIHDPYQLEELRTDPNFTGKRVPNDQRVAAIVSKGGNASRIITEFTSIQDVLRSGSSFSQTLKGKTIWIANAPFECLAGNTLVQQRDGDLVELSSVTAGSEILGTEPADTSLREVGIVETKSPINKGVKHSFEVHPVYGLPTIASDGHLWFTQRGWLRTDELLESDWLLSCFSSGSDLELTPSGLSTDELELVGWFLAEGRHPTHGKDFRRTPGKENKAAALIRELGLDNRHSYEKIIPSRLLRAPNSELKHVLRTMYAGDGYVSKGGLVYTTTSKRLAEQLLLVLHRFGIWSRFVEVEDNREPKTVYRVETPSEACEIFAQRIGRKERELLKHLRSWSSRKQLWKRQHTGVNTGGMYDVLSWDALRTLEAAFEGVLVSDTLMWTPIKSITDAGFQEVWDVEVDTSEFLANGLVVHNSKSIGSAISALPTDVFDAVRKGIISEDAARAAQMSQSGLLDVVRAANPRSAENLYVTGVEVNRARFIAQVTSDWRPVFEAYLHHTKPGDVRDIIDVLRAHQSYGRSLGILTSAGREFGTSMDIAFRLFGSTEQDRNLAAILFNMAEAHRAVEDVALTEDMVLNKAVRQTEALREVSRGSATGMDLIRMAKQGRGALFEAMIFFRRLDALASVLQEQNAMKRIGRLFEDFATQSSTFQFAGYQGSRTIKHITQKGETEELVVARMGRRRFSDIETAVKYIRETEQYAGTDFDRIWNRMRGHMINEGALRVEGGRTVVSDPKLLSEATSIFLSENADRAALDRVIADVTAKAGDVDTFLRQTSLPALNNQIMRVAGRDTPKQLNVMGRMTASKAMTGGVLAFASVSALGLAFGRRPDQNEYSHTSLRSMGYQNWLDYHAANAGLNNNDENWSSGLNSSGLLAHTRRMFTDFGSPYRGPWTSNAVLLDQELLEERERYMRRAFGARHYDPVSGLFASFRGIRAYNPLSKIKGEFSLGSVDRIDPDDYAGMRGSNLVSFKVDKDRWKISAADADTVTVSRRGVAGAVQSFFGMNRFSFRLAGIDSPELSHGSNSWYAPQPHAQQAKNYLDAVVAGDKLEIVFDPNNTTYGRAVGALFQGKKNINFQLVKLGHAAALPFGDISKAPIDYSVALAHEGMARDSGRGLHSEPFFQTYMAMSDKMRDRLTFNTLASRSKVAKNSMLMSGASLMRQAQEQGYAGMSDLKAAAEIGSTLNRRGTYADYRRKDTYKSHQQPHNNYMAEMLRDTSEFMQTRGSDMRNKMSHTSGYGKLDQHMAVDTTGTTTSVYAKKNLEAFSLYAVDRAKARQKKAHQAALQRDVNQTMFNSPIGHHRM